MHEDVARDILCTLLDPKLTEYDVLASVVKIRCAQGLQLDIELKILAILFSEVRILNGTAIAWCLLDFLLTERSPNRSPSIEGISLKYITRAEENENRRELINIAAQAWNALQVSEEGSSMRFRGLKFVQKWKRLNLLSRTEFLQLKADVSTNHTFSLPPSIETERLKANDNRVLSSGQYTDMNCHRLEENIENPKKITKLSPYMKLRSGLFTIEAGKPINGKNLHKRVAARVGTDPTQVKAYQTVWNNILYSAPSLSYAYSSDESGGDKMWCSYCGQTFPTMAAVKSHETCHTYFFISGKTFFRHYGQSTLKWINHDPAVLHETGKLEPCLTDRPELA